MPEPIVIIDSSEIRPGKLDDVRQAITALADFVAEHEPRAIGYNVYVDGAGTRMTVVQVHPDSASAEYHMTVAAPAFRPFIELLRLDTMDVYGEPSGRLLALLRTKAEMLGASAIAVHAQVAGFTRVAVG